MGNNILTMNKDLDLAGFSLFSDGFFTEAIVDSLSSGVIFSDTLGVLTFMNKRAESLLHVIKETVIGKRIDMLPLRTPLYKVMSEECRDNPLEMNIFGRVIEVKSSELVGQDNVVLGYLTELFDVTQDRQDKRRREEFVAKMTHDLKSPLMVLQGYMQAIRLGMSGDVPPKLRKTLDDMERSGKSLHAMIEDLLDVYRLEMGLVQIKREHCDIVRFLEDCCRDRYLEAEEQSVEIQFEECSVAEPVAIDRKQMGRVFANVIGNAIKFTPRGGTVRVQALDIDGSVHVVVRDTGIGIPARDIPHVFKKYYRSEQATGFKGSGLGLALSKEIVEAHGGTIEVVSRDGEGSTFTIIIPVPE
jgi:signal transduction histidine kinase